VRIVSGITIPIMYNYNILTKRIGRYFLYKMIFLETIAAVKTENPCKRGFL